MTTGLSARAPVSAVLVALFLASAAPPARAGTDDTPVSLAELRRLSQRGNSEYALGHFKAAMELFENAYRLKPIAGLLYNIAQCHRQLRQFEEAATTYRSFIRLDPESPNVGNARALLVEVEAAMAAQAKAQSAPPLDGNELRPGTAAARGKTPAAKSATPDFLLPKPPAPPAASADLEPAFVKPAPLVVVQPPLPPIAPPPGAQPPPPQKVAVVETKPKPPAPAASVEAAPAPQQHARVVTWIAGGAGVAALGAGAVFGLAAKSASNDLTSSPHTRSEIADLQDQQKSRAGMANIFFIAGAGLLVAGGVLYLLHL